MKNRKISFVTTLTVSLLGLLPMAAPGCGSDDKSSGGNTTIGNQDAGQDSGSGNGNDASSGGSSNGGSGNAPDASGGSGNNSGDASTDAGGQLDAGDGGPNPCSVPLGQDGCFNCPSTTAEFLNRCTSSDCAPFDNHARLPHLKPDGTLPPLQ